MINAAKTSLTELVWLTLAFGVVAKLVFRNQGFDFLPGGRKDWLLNVTYLLADAFFVIPIIVLINMGLTDLLAPINLSQQTAIFFSESPPLIVLIAAVMLSDFVGYWRHRLMHVSFLWPIHAAHHSDKNLSWLSLLRFHPFNRFIAAACDALVMGMLGFPLWAIAASNFIRHYYGYFIHADLPWTFGPLEKIFVSPVMHRWHHSIIDRAYRGNFATVFALYDWIFGTWYVPHKTIGELGESIENYPTTWLGQFFYPFKAWLSK